MKQYEPSWCEPSGDMRARFPLTRSLRDGVQIICVNNPDQTQELELQIRDDSGAWHICCSRPSRANDVLLHSDHPDDRLFGAVLMLVGAELDRRRTALAKINQLVNTECDRVGKDG